MDLTPLFDRVLALPIKQNFATASGIATSSNNQERTTKSAKVINVGKGEYDCGVFVEMQTEIGDTIFFEEHTVSKIVFQEKEYILIKQTDILAKIKGEN